MDRHLSGFNVHQQLEALRFHFQCLKLRPLLFVPLGACFLWMSLGLDTGWECWRWNYCCCMDGRVLMII